MSRAYCEMIIERGGGIVTCGQHLGVFVSTPDRVAQCPAGWVFVDITTTTVEQLQEAIDCAKAGRSEWPKKQIVNSRHDQPEEVAVE